MNLFKQFITSSISLFLLHAIGVSQDLYFPPNNSNDWETLSPESQGYCQERIDSLYNFLDEQDSKAFLLLKDGKIVLEHYTGTFTADSSWYWASAGKTLTSFLVGVAQEQGALSLDDPTAMYLGEGWTSCTPADESQILIRHQLTMTSGLDDGLGDVYCTLPECLECIASPGTRWAYHNGPYTLLDQVMENATGQNLNLFAYQNVFNSTGMSGLYVQVDFNNVFFSKARSMARFGLLLLNDGIWDGSTVLGDSDYLYDMTHSSQEINPSYGYLTWLNGYDQVMLPSTQIVFQGPLFPAAPADAYAALGKNGQILNVVPSQNMVVVRMGNDPGNEFAVSSLLNDDIWEYINALTCSPNAIPEPDDTGFFSVVPAPGIDQYLIKMKNEHTFELELFNIAGASMLKAKNEHTLSLSWLSTGVYLLHLRTDSAEQVFKLMKE